MMWRQVGNKYGTTMEKWSLDEFGCFLVWVEFGENRNVGGCLNCQRNGRRSSRIEKGYSGNLDDLW